MAHTEVFPACGIANHSTTISIIEVTNTFNHGVWLLAHDRKLFMPCDEFPSFKDQPVKASLNVEEPSLGHFY